jgi:amino acid adenylation domain-containing protein
MHEAPAQRTHASTSASDPGASLLGRFQQFARLDPERVAIERDGVGLSYGELDERSTRLAQRLRSLGVETESVVGICLPREPVFVVALLAVLKAGAAYLPLDPAYPQDRRLYMVTDAGAKVVLGGPELADELAEAEVTVVSPEDEAGRDALASTTWAEPQPQDLAYVMYTSGSTGRPKGVMIERRSMHAFVEWGLESFSPEELESVLASTSFSFDISIFELMVPLAAGGRMVLVDNLLAMRQSDGGVSLVNTVPSVMAALLKDSALPASVRTVIMAGEPLSGEIADAVHDQPGVTRVVNGYGPTEDTIYSTACDVPRGTRPLIGTSLTGKYAYVLDEALQPVAPGTPGELFLGGIGVARGYRGREDLTRERFVPNPLPDAVCDLLYKTGDVASFEPDGSLRHLGRADDQIKIRGVRIEPGEIESALMKHGAIQRAVALKRDNVWGQDHLLVAYLQAEAGQAVPASTELREYLRASLPEPMVPSAFVHVEEWPLTPNGKLDKSKLPDPEERHGQSDAGDLSEHEARLAALWSEALTLDFPPGPEDDFFDLGGASIVAVELITLVEGEFGVELTPNVLVEDSTVRALAARIAANRGATDERLVTLGEGDAPPLVYLHAAAGGMRALRALGTALGEGQPFVAIQSYPDREHTVGEMLPVSVTADSCLELLKSVQPEGPYLLAGHSIGGAVAYEIASRLRAAGEEVALLALLDTPAPDTLSLKSRLAAHARTLAGRNSHSDRKLGERIAGAARSARTKALRKLRHAPVSRSEVAEHDRWLSKLAERERTYEPPKYPGEVVVLGTEGSIYAFDSKTLGWDRHVTGTVEAVLVPGGHLTMLEHPHLSVLARELSERVRAAQP